MLLGYIASLIVGVGLYFALAKIPFKYRCSITLLVTVPLLVSWTLFLLSISDKPQEGARTVDPFTRVGVMATDASQIRKVDQRVWLVRHSELFERADLSDYCAINDHMQSLQVEANLSHGAAYLIPMPQGPTLMMLSSEPEEITKPEMDKLFLLIERELLKRLESRKSLPVKVLKTPIAGAAS